jgi:hypothetical protein
MEALVTWGRRYASVIVMEATAIHMLQAARSVDGSTQQAVVGGDGEQPGQAQDRARG